MLISQNKLLQILHLMRVFHIMWNYCTKKEVEETIFRCTGRHQVRPLGPLYHLEILLLSDVLKYATMVLMMMVICLLTVTIQIVALKRIVPVVIFQPTLNLTMVLRIGLYKIHNFAVWACLCSKILINVINGCAPSFMGCEKW